MPPHRKLADELGLSVQTVSRSYEELIRRGLVTGEVGRGSFVLGPGQEARQPYLPERPGEVIDLSILKPAVGAMHVAKMRDGFAWLAENLSASAALSFRPNTVMPHHRAVAADWLARGGISADPSGIAITNGATPAITAALMSSVPPGSALAAEALTHHMLMPLCGYLGIHLEGVAIDDQGMLPDALNEIARKGLIRCVYLQPSVINPLGSMMGLERREALVEVARRHDLAIVENDILNALIADRPPPIAALAPERTLHINGFTKITVPGLRLAYLAAPARYATAVANRHLVAHWMATPPMVELLDHWIGDGTVDELIAIQRAALAERHAICRADSAQGVAGSASAKPASVAAPSRGVVGRRLCGTGAPKGRGACGRKRLPRDRKGSTRGCPHIAWIDLARGTSPRSADRLGGAAPRARGASAGDLTGCS